MRLLFLLSLCLATFPAFARPPPSLASQATSVRYLLRNLPGVTVAVDGDHLAINGTVTSLEDLDRVVRVTHAYPGTQNLVALHPEASANPEAPANPR